MKEDFFIGDVQVGEERHILFAIPNQQKFLQQANRWYLDGTFRVVRKNLSEIRTNYILRPKYIVFFVFNLSI